MVVDKIAVVVVLYNPEEAVLENITTYYHSIDKLYAVDNSDLVNTQLLEILSNKVPHLHYTSFNGNLGIAKALNVAASNALKEGYEWLLMMDQDSRFSHDGIEALIAAINTLSDENTGIIAPRYTDAPSPLPTTEIEEVQTVITSGSLLNLKAYSQVGPFRDDLFIDFVDHEYCLRLRQHNFKLLVNNKVKLEHQLGKLSCHNFLGWQLCTSNHNYLRRYYITRNRLEIVHQFKDQFPDFIASEKNKNLVEIVKVLFFEEDKLRKLKSFILGYLDFKRRKFGRYSY